ncbi:aldo/keto reductase [Phyllobacterium sp. SB3]|uniref:aldo/keto reductase n=1 Tax=Phyllobacterium sp. SB3 TaxID=3156073 RepID=UPI0032AE8BAA
MSIYFEKTYQRSFGTFPLKGEELSTAVSHAIDAGYRSFDTAQMYRNEAHVGVALAATGVSRDELCITTKVHPDNFGKARFIASVERSLKDLKVERVDALLVHWPPLDGNIAPSLKLLVEAKNRGLTDHIGVSNYTSKMMREARSIIDEPLITNQVEFQPLLNQDILLDAAVETGIPLSSYCSVARGEVFKYPLFAEIGALYGKSAAQIVLRWILQKGVPINTMSVKPENIRANFDVMDFTLSNIHMAQIDAMTSTGFRVVGKNLVPWAPDWD